MGTNQPMQEYARMSPCKKLFLQNRFPSRADFILPEKRQRGSCAELRLVERIRFACFKASFQGPALARIQSQVVLLSMLYLIEAANFENIVDANVESGRSSLEVPEEKMPCYRWSIRMPVSSSSTCLAVRKALLHFDFPLPKSNLLYCTGCRKQAPQIYRRNAQLNVFPNV